MKTKLDAGVWKLGGCCDFPVQVKGETVNLKPARYCNICHRDFGTAPVLISRNSGTGEDYRDIAESVYFSVGGFFNGHSEVKITRNDGGALVETKGLFGADAGTTGRQISYAGWRHLLNTLYTKMYLHEWKKKYVDPCTLDGTQWELRIKLTGGRECKYYGSNEYPPYWPELKKVFRKYFDIDPF
ncbi:MAG: hypothetical protein ACOX78_09880 [Lachnospiraceae bacterium]